MMTGLSSRRQGPRRSRAYPPEVLHTVATKRALAAMSCEPSATGEESIDARAAAEVPCEELAGEMSAYQLSFFSTLPTVCLRGERED